MKKTYLTALVVALVIVAWLVSGPLLRDEADNPAPSLAEDRTAMAAEAEDRPTRVRARVLRAEAQTADVVVRGRTRADRTVEVRAETSGPVAELPVDKGDAVAAGDVLCRIAPETRPARIEEAEQALRQARIEYEGAQQLAERGYQSETAIAAASARVAAARAELAQRELDLAHTAIRAPFDGLVEERPVEVGDLLRTGEICAVVIDPDPMLLVGEVGEQEVGRVDVGDAGVGRLVTGETVRGEVVFVARRADSGTRTFVVEVAVPNPEAALRDGITAEIRIPTSELPAHRLPSALLALDDSGDLGVRILDDDDRVRFVPVEVLEDTASGVWVTGLPETVTIITVGQELVSPGQQVVPVLEDSSTLPTAGPEREAPADDDRAEIGGGSAGRAGSAA